MIEKYYLYTKETIAPILFSILMLFAPAYSYSQNSILDKVVAIANDDVILASQLDERLKSLVQQANKRGQDIPPLEYLVPQILEQLIIESLQLQLAERAGVVVTEEELQAALASIARQNKIPPNDLEYFIEKDGLSFNSFKKSIEDEIIIQRIQQAAVTKRINISEQDINNFLNSEEGRLGTNETYRMSHIILNYNTGSDNEEQRNIEELAADIVTQAREGQDFAKLALEYSSSPDKNNGGDLGWRTRKEVPTLYLNSVSSMAKGDISEPIASDEALHIIKLVDKKGGKEHWVQQTHVRHILVKPSAIRNHEEAAALLNELRQQIQAGADFAELAKTHSEDFGSALKGGDLGWTLPGQMVPQFQQVMDNLSVNVISQPFQTQYGWHILEVLGREEKNMGKELVRQAALQLLQNRQFDIELPLWLQELRNDAYVVIKDPELTNAP